MTEPSARPIGPSDTSTPTYADVEREVLSAFAGNIDRVGVPVTYRLGVLLVAVVMVILPLLYIGIIGLVGYGVYYHAVNHTGMLEAGRGRGKVMVFLAYLAPMIVGAILVLFMFKPLLSRPGKGSKKQSLAPDDEPLLFSFVNRICEAVRAPAPKRIDIDCEVNASASFQHGAWSMFGNDLVLTIGLPLVAGLNSRQFAGVLAHEFGHFAQGAGMRLTYIIRSISHWFTRVVYERDAWDDRLVEWSQGIDLRFGWILYLARMFVWLTRKILWVLMVVGHAVSGYMLRQMEFDADRHEARLAGSDAFESTARRLIALNFANQGAQSDLGSFYREGRLGDNLPKLIMHNVGQFSPETFGKIDGIVDQSATGWFDTHPCDKERITNARQENAAGIFHIEKPASILFRDFAATSRDVTWQFYRDIFGQRFNHDEVHPIDELLARQSLENEAYQALNRCFCGTYRVDRPLKFPAWQIGPPKDVDRAAAQLRRLREKLLAGVATYQTVCSRFDEADAEDEHAIVPEMEPFEKVAGGRLFVSLALLHVPDVLNSIDDALDWQQECAKLLPVCERLNDQVPQFNKLGLEHATLTAILEQLAQNNQDQGLINAVLKQMKVTFDLVQQMRQTLMKVEYPFEHAKQKISIGEFAVADVPDHESPGEIYTAAEELLGSLNMLRARIVGRLCVFAEAVESTFGLDPFPEPVDEPEPTGLLPKS